MCIVIFCKWLPVFVKLTLLNIPHINNSATAWWCQLLYRRFSKVSKTSVMFIDPCAKVDNDCRTRVLRQGLLLDISANYGHWKWTLQQDVASSWTAHNTIVYSTCSVRMSPSFSMTCGPNSLDLKSVDYAIRGPTGVSLPRQTCNKSSNSKVQVQVQVHLKWASPSPSPSPLQRRQVQVQVQVNRPQVQVRIQVQ